MTFNSHVTSDCSWISIATDFLATIIAKVSTSLDTLYVSVVQPHLVNHLLGTSTYWGHRKDILIIYEWLVQLESSLIFSTHSKVMAPPQWGAVIKWLHRVDWLWELHRWLWSPQVALDLNLSAWEWILDIWSQSLMRLDWNIKAGMASCTTVFSQLIYHLFESPTVAPSPQKD